MSGIDRGRRKLVGGLVAGAAAAVAAPAAARARSGGPAVAQHDARVGIAIVGLGSYARYAIERLAGAQLARPAGIVSGSPERAREAAARYGVPEDAVYGYGDYARLAADERIDAVHVCLPVGLHAAHALEAIAAGKHVLVEKPLAATLAEAQALADAARAAGRVLMPAYRAWFSDALQDARLRVREGRHGELVSIDAHKGFTMVLPEGNWRFDPALAGGGCLFDIGIYSVQLQRWIAGGMPTRVSAFASRMPGDARFARAESDVSWLAEFESGVLATGSASWRYRLQNRARIGCTQGWLDLEPATPAIGERLRFGADQPNRIEELLHPLRDQLPKMYDAFAEACLGRAPVPVPAEEGLADLRFMDAIYRSATTDLPVSV
jgi:glucose-fructose oxidoreductase